MKKGNLKYEEMKNFILNNIEYTYGVSNLLESFIFGMKQTNLYEDIFETPDKDKFKITIKPKKTEYTTDYFFDIEKV